ncbi:MAG: hypothetical protein HKM98_02375 [Gammaproteobacteria bacterium]|nr:hypothetical protein [Gammaproteobacteria bacterium]
MGIELLELLTYGGSTLVLVALLAVALFTDLRWHRIPNAVSFGGVLLALAWAVAQDFGVPASTLGANGLIECMLGLLVGLGVFLPFYALGGMGAGDVKLMAMAGAFLGPGDAIIAAAVALVLGGCIALVLLAIKNGLKPALQRYWATLRTFHYVPPDKGEAATIRFPYAIAIFSGVAIVLWQLSYMAELQTSLYLLLGR